MAVDCGIGKVIAGGLTLPMSERMHFRLGCTWSGNESATRTEKQKRAAVTTRLPGELLRMSDATRPPKVRYAEPAKSR